MYISLQITVRNLVIEAALRIANAETEVHPCFTLFGECLQQI
ncbi:hypothetical protein [Candidatus Vallotia cooleyia]|nr:hypothetical protein [Candidatus Vallotia cooleyia]